MVNQAAQNVSTCKQGACTTTISQCKSVCQAAVNQHLAGVNLGNPAEQPLLEAMQAELKKCNDPQWSADAANMGTAATQAAGNHVS